MNRSIRFQSALDQPAELRAGFVADVCAGDAELQAAVESLLNAHDQAGYFIEDSAANVATALVIKNAQRPTQVEHYKIEKASRRWRNGRGLPMTFLDLFPLQFHYEHIFARISQAS